MRAALATHPHVGEVRGEGMFYAVDFVDDKDSRTFFDADRIIGPSIAAALLGLGVIARALPQGDILGFAPPFCPSREEADQVVGNTREAVEAVLGS